MHPSSPFYKLDTSIPIYSGKEPLKSTILNTHQKRVLHYIRMLESEHPIPILSNQSVSDSDLYFHTNYAFYADPICTGKSYVILSLLSLHKCVERKNLLTIWSNGLGMNVFSKIKTFDIPMSILVVPLYSVGQWSELFQNETDIKFYIVDDQSKVEKINTYDYDVLLVADLVFDLVCLHFKGFSVSRIIFDDLLHLNIKDLSKKDSSQFGDLRASFTWFVSSQPNECLSKYRGSHLPFAYLIQQIFSFPYPGLLFKNEESSFIPTLTQMLPEIEIKNTNTYLPYKSLTNFSFDDEEIIVPFFVNVIEIQCKDLSDVVVGLSNEMKETFQERYKNRIDPITYEPIKYPVYQECCHQIFELAWLCKSIWNDNRCPYCRKDSSFTMIIGIDKSIYNPILQKTIWNKLDEIDMNQYNILYVPSLKMKGQFKSRMLYFYKQLHIRYNFHILYGSKVFQDFQKTKGLLVISKPIQSNLHLRFVDNIYVIHPKEYVVLTKTEWFSDQIVHKYGQDFRSEITDQEMGSFCIGSEKKINFEFIRLL